MIQIRKLSHFKKFWLPSCKFWTAKKDTDSDSMHCTALREQESAANRTTGRTGAAQPDLSWNSGREETEILARVHFYSNVREGELVPVAKFAFRAASTVFHPRPGAGTNLSGSPASTLNAARGA